MQKPIIFSKTASVVELDAGTFYWCACGKSQNQPFCDGSHKLEGKFRSMKYLAEETKEVYFCGCKMTKHPPFCDGSHSKPD